MELIPLATKPIHPVPRRYATPKQVAEYLGVSDRTVRTMVSDGRLVAYRNGPRLVRLDLNEVDAAMERFGGGIA